MVLYFPDDGLHLGLMERHRPQGRWSCVGQDVKELRGMLVGLLLLAKAIPGIPKARLVGAGRWEVVVVYLSLS